jgi:hypothetical protein
VVRFAIEDATIRKDVIFVAILLLRYFAKNVENYLIPDMDIAMIMLESTVKGNNTIGKGWWT